MWCQAGTCQPLNLKASQTCNPCPPLTTALFKAAIAVESSSLPYLAVDPSHGNTPVDVLWATQVEAIQQLQDEEKLVQVSLWVVSTWRDDSVLQTIGEGIQSLAAVGWQELSLWLPKFTVNDAEEQTVLQENNKVVSSDIGWGYTKGYCTRTTLLSTQVLWGGSVEYPTHVQGQTWCLFPVGKQTLNVCINCPSDAICSCASCAAPSEARRRARTDWDADVEVWRVGGEERASEAMPVDGADVGPGLEAEGAWDRVCRTRELSVADCVAHTADGRRAGPARLVPVITQASLQEPALLGVLGGRWQPRSPTPVPR